MAGTTCEIQELPQFLPSCAQAEVIFHEFQIHFRSSSPVSLS